MNQTELSKCAQLDLLKELDRICKKRNISYFLTGGTLLGAIRHNGFIPWDDDLDVALLRPDYERLMEAFREELDPAFFVHNWHSDPHSPLPYAKLKIRGTHYRETVSDGCAMDDAIFIDIFPYDNTPVDPKVQKKQEKQLFLLRRLIMVRAGFRLGGDSAKKRLAYGALRLLSFLLPMDWMKRRFDEICAWGGEGDSEFVTCLHGAYAYKRETKPRAMLEKTTTHVFETGEFSVPEAYDAFLRSHYGDYMQLPPVEQRKGVHGILRMDLGAYQVHSRLAAHTEEENNG